MPGRRCRNWLVPLGSAALLVAGCSAQSAYLNATQTFATSTRMGVEVFKPAASSAHDICIARAEIKFLQTRLEEERSRTSGGAGAPQQKVVRRSAWYTTLSVGPVPGISWSAYCDEIGKTHTGLRKIYTALGGYADALGAMEKGAQIDSAKLDSSTKDAASLIEELELEMTPAGSNGAKLINFMKNSAGPLNELATAVEQAVAERNARQAVKRTDPALQALLEQLLGYSRATQDEALVLENDTEVLLDWVDTTMASARPDPLRIVEMTQYMRDAERTVREDVDAQTKYQEAVKALQGAHAALKKATTEELTPQELAATMAVCGQEVSESVKDIRRLLHLEETKP